MNKTLKKNSSCKAPKKTSERRILHERRLDIMNIELGIYREIGALAVKRGNQKVMLQRLMDLVLKALKTDAGTLYLLDEKAGELIFAIVKGSLAGRLKGMRIRADKGIVGRVAKSNKPYVSEDIEKDKVWLGIKSGEASRNIMAVPLHIKKKVIGVIEVINKKRGKVFTKSDLRVLTSLANHFSMIMESADLFKELDEKVNEFSILNDIGNLLVSTLDQKVVRRMAIEAITRLMKAEAGSLLLVDDKTNELFFEVALGEKGEKIKEVRLKMGEGIAGWVAAHGKPLIVKDASKDKRFQGRVDKKSEFKTRNMVCVPVVIKGKVIGVLQAINRLHGDTFTNKDKGLFQMFSNQVAIALDNARLYGEIKDTFYATSEALAEAIEKRDPYTGGHTKRVLTYSMAAAKHMGLSPETLELLKFSAVLHDIGKIGIEDSILRKQAPLDDAEAAEMKKHPLLGADILKHVPQLKEIVPGMLCHHERIDGRGYPNGFSDSQIPLIAKIISVADTYDAMTTTRPYRKALPTETALKELEKFSGTQFDSGVVKAFIKAFQQGDIPAASTEATAMAEVTPRHP